ncbi:paraquat-inducible protein A [Haliea sp. E17]|uniref:paraquat-inducible protein A n=1 Tax=Haliea sp. E17 TaxID=3401576 RepID=UPI003AABAD91
MLLKRKLLVLASIVLSLALLYPGVTLPVLTLQGSIERSQLAEMGITMLAGENASEQQRQMLGGLAAFMGLDQMEGEVQIYHSTRSIWETAEDLAASHNLFVALLILTFSIVIPTCKLLLQAVTLAVEHPALVALNSALSKWSMADVFVMALLVTYLAGSASGRMGDQLTMQAQLEPGFYCFLGYCLFSIVAGGLLRRAAAPAANA